MVDGLPVGGDTGNPLPKEGQGGCPAHASIIPVSQARDVILVGISNYVRGRAGKVKVTWSLDGLCCRFSFVYRSRRVSTIRERGEQGRVGSQIKYNEDRARCAVYRRVKLMGSVVVQITLTCGGVRFRSWSEAMGMVSKWVCYLRRRGLVHMLGGDYVAVAEPHKSGGAWHAHMVCARDRFTQAELEVLRSTWTRVLERNGYLVGARRGQARYHRLHVRVKGSRLAASYCAKYVGKAFGAINGVGGGRPIGRARYVASRCSLKCRTVYMRPSDFLRLFDTAVRGVCHLIEIYGSCVLCGYLYFDLLTGPARAPCRRGDT